MQLNKENIVIKLNTFVNTQIINLTVAYFWLYFFNINKKFFFPFYELVIYFINTGSENILLLLF